MLRFRLHSHFFSMPLTALVSLSLSFQLISCKESSSENASVLATSSTGLVFTGANSTEWPWQNNVYRMNTETFEVEQLLTGESNDSVVFTVGGEVLLFNRSSESQNYRLVSPQSNTFLIGPQTKFADGVAGDPHDIVDLGNGSVLLSHYNQGKLSIMNVKSGEKLSEVAADWDLPAGVTLKPDALWRKTVGEHTYIYVVHQAYAFENNVFFANGSQTVFVLEQKGADITAVDLDPASDKVQGIKVKGSFPVVVRSETASDKLLLVSMCSRFVSPSPSDASVVCHSAAEEIDPTTQTSKVLWDLDGSKFFMNGSVIAAGSDGHFFAQVEEQTGPETFVRRIVKFDPITQTSETTYDYEAESGGYYGLYYDEMRSNLFIGDINAAGGTVGKFTIIKADGTRSVKTLDAIPYSGTFVF